MDIKIEIVSADYRKFSGTSKAGKAYDMAMQDAYLHTGGTYPDKFEVPVPKLENGDRLPYQPGFYTVTPKSFQVRDSRLAINSFEMELTRLPADGAAASKPRAVGG